MIQEVNIMKEYVEPEVEVIELDDVDVMCSSADEGPCGGYVCGYYGSVCTGYPLGG